MSRSIPPLTAASFLMLASAAYADVLTVETAADAFTNPPPGSLRHILKNVAKAGDTIRFAENFVIVMEDDLFDVPQSLAGLRIEGPVQIRQDGSPGRLSIRAPRAVLSNVSFRNVFVSIGSDADDGSRDIDGVEVRDCSFSLRGGVRVTNAVDCLVDHCTFTLDAGEAADVAAIDCSGMSSSRISRNTITVLGGPAPAIELTEGRGSIVEDNVCPGGVVSVRTESGVVRRNQLGNGRLEVSTELQSGSFDVRGNVCELLRVLVVDVVIADNLVGGAAPAAKKRAPEAQLYVLGEYKKQSSHAGATVLTGNRVRGGSDISIRCVTGALTTAVTLSDNTVLDPAPTAMFVSSTTPTTVLRTTITGNGGKGKRIGLEIARSPAEGTRVEDSVIAGVAGFGLIVDKGAAATLVHNRVTGCALGGFVVGRNARADSSRDTAQDNGGDGFRWVQGASGSMADGTISGNRGAGVFVDAGAAVGIRRTSCSANDGPGIDLAPDGVTANSKKKSGNAGIGWPAELKFDTTQHAITGKAAPGTVIEIFRVEEGARAGNPANGEGADFLATGIADQEGKFAVKPKCKQGEKVTVTATLPGTRAVTSEFSEDIECEEGPAVELVSASPADEPAATGASFGPYGNRVVSGDGRFIVFTSAAPNLSEGAVAGVTYAYLRDTLSGITTRVTRSFDGSAFDPGEYQSSGFAGFEPSLSDDGRFVAYATPSKKVIAGDANYDSDVVLFDAESGTTVAVTDPTTQVPPLANGYSYHFGGYSPTISGDGGTVAFVSTDANWVPGGPKVDEDVFVWTRATGAIERASGVTAAGVTRLMGAGKNETPLLSHDGRLLVFASYQNLVPGNTATGYKIFVRDRDAGTTALVSVDASGAARQGRQPAISDDGRYVAFISSDRIDPNDTDSEPDVYVRDRQEGTTRRISVHADGSSFLPGNSVHNATPTISGDGQRIAFATSGSFRIPSGLTILNIADVWLADLVAGTIEEASIGPDGEALGFTASPRLSGDGLTLVFVSDATNLVPGADDQTTQVYARRLAPR